MRAWALAVALAGCGGGAAAQDMLAFQSPTGNIHCMMLAGDWTGARCDLRDYVPSFPVRPMDCEQDWGFGFEVTTRGPGTPVCAGDTVVTPGAPVLDYGQSVTLGGITCRSEPTGMTCTNRAGGGFTLARARQRVF